MDDADQIKAKLDLDSALKDIEFLKEGLALANKEIAGLFDAYTRCDARILAYQMIIPFLFGKNKEQKEAFENDLEGKYQTLYSLMKEEYKKKDPKGYRRVYECD